MALKKFNDSTISKVIDILTGEVELDSNGNEMFVEFYSADSKRYRKSFAARLKENEGKKATKKTNDEVITDIIADCLISWNIEMPEGHVPLSFENAVYVLEERRDIREMIAENQNDRKIFLQK